MPGPLESSEDPGSRAPGGRLSAGALHVLAAFGYLALTLFYLRPTWSRITTALAPDLGDPLFVVYLLKWGIRQLHAGMPDFWNAPFFFPAQAVTTYSDHLLGPAVLAAAVDAVNGNVLLAYNLLFLLAFALGGWTTWFVLRKSGLGAPAAFLGGVMWTFSSFRWCQLSHLQILLVPLLPLVLWLFDRLAAEPTWRRAALFLAAYLAHLSGGCYLAYMIHFPLLVLFANRLPALVRERRLLGALRILVPTGTIAALAFLLLFRPYLESSQSVLQRTPEMIRQHSATLVSYLTPARENLYSSLWPKALWREEGCLFAGFLPTALTLLALARRRRADRSPLTAARRVTLGALLGLAVIGFANGEIETWTGDGLAAHLGLTSAAAGFAFLALLPVAGLAAFFLHRRWIGRWPLVAPGTDLWERGLLAAGAVAFFLSSWGIYRLLVPVVPGLSSMRVPLRFYPFVSLALCFLAARELEARLSGWSARRRGVALGAFTALLVLELAPSPLPWNAVASEPDFAPVYAWIANRSEVHALLELPLGSGIDPISYLYFGTRHWKPLVNGYSGFYPPTYLSLRARCCWPAPDERTIRLLRSWGVDHVLIHRWQLRPHQRDGLTVWEKTAPVRQVYGDDGDRVYQLLPPTSEDMGNGPA